MRLLGAGWRWGRLSLHSLGINLPLPAVITAKRPTGTTPQTPGGWNKLCSRLGASVAASGQWKGGKGEVLSSSTPMESERRGLSFPEYMNSIPPHYYIS